MRVRARPFLSFGERQCFQNTLSPDAQDTRSRRAPRMRGCLKSRLLFRQPVEFKIKSLYYNDLILNVAYKIKEAAQKLQFLDSPMSVSESGAAGSSDRPLRKKIRCMTGCYIRAFMHSIKRMMFSTVSRRSLLARSFARL